jgi:hypothetical protein
VPVRISVVLPSMVSLHIKLTSGLLLRRAVPYFTLFNLDAHNETGSTAHEWPWTPSPNELLCRTSIIV